MEKMKVNCPSGHGEMKLTHKEKQGAFRGESISYHLECYICPVCGLEAGRAEVVGQVLEANYYGNGTEKIDKATFTGTIAQCNTAIRDYNKLLKTHCDESTYRYDELKIEEFREPTDWVYQ